MFWDNLLTWQSLTLRVSPVTFHHFTNEIWGMFPRPTTFLYPGWLWAVAHEGSGGYQINREIMTGDTSKGWLNTFPLGLSSVSPHCWPIVGFLIRFFLIISWLVVSGARLSWWPEVCSSAFYWLSRDSSRTCEILQDRNWGLMSGNNELCVLTQNIRSLGWWNGFPGTFHWSANYLINNARA